MNQIALRASIDELEHHRNRAFDLFGQAFDLVQEAAAEARSAAPSGVMSLPTIRDPSQHWSRDDRDQFLEGVRRQIDRAVWSHLLKATGLDKLMDKTAKEQFRDQLEKDPPPATVDNCRATIEQLIGDADLIFKRGIATTFSRLDRRFRSHDGFKIGSRIVLDNMLGPDGWWNHWRRHDDTLIDVERTFYLLDCAPQPNPDAGIVGKIRVAKQDAGLSLQCGTFEAEDDFFRVKVFKNGNAHVWFKRDDLVAKVNQLLAEYYGASLGAAPDVADKHHEPTRAVAKNFGLFETPSAVVGRLLDDAGSVREVRCLEPSAGRGAIADPLRRAGASVTCVEIQPGLADALRALGFADVICGDFLDQTVGRLGEFERIVMNPPFDRGRDVDHVTHALKFLASGGRLIAVMASGVEYREDRKTVDFRAMVERFGGRFYDLPLGSFAESGTNVNTVVLTLNKPRAG